jgi:hypothetical protein
MTEGYIERVAYDAGVKRIRDLERERLMLLGYISTTPPHTDKHPEEVIAWWEARMRGEGGG